MSLLPLSTSTAIKNNASPCRTAKTRFSNTSVRRLSYISCNQQPPPDSNPNNRNIVIDRRNVLLGLSGVYGSAATLGSTAFAAEPVQPPDLEKCHLATDTQIPPGEDNKVECCPPKYENKNIVDFKPHEFTCLRIRRPAHKLDSEYIAKFKEAISKMKNLPKEDPWNFFQQAQVHCAFCNNAYDQFGFPGTPLQVHSSFLFGPWHRYYLYFWEKILGKLIGDPTFAIPFWNWDAPAGMYMPDIYKDEKSPLYNANRNPDHYSALYDYKYKYGDPNPTPSEKDAVILSNLIQLGSTFTEATKTPQLFMGAPVAAGQEVETRDKGSLESLHDVLHQWVGPLLAPNWDMGNFHTAARDTTFWGHHSNVDRLWYLLTSFRGNKPEFKNKEWLDASFVFYDENRQLVRCKVRDCLDIAKLGYTYEPEELPWLGARRSYIKQQRLREKRGAERAGLIDVKEFGSTPRVLGLPIRVLVRRPKTSLSKDDKEKVAEVLTIDNIVIADEKKHQRFDVYVSKPINGKASSDLGEFAGAFTYIPISGGKKKVINVLNLGITSLVENIEADSSENLVVSVIPGIGEVTIGGVKISLLDIDDE